jgi:diacylglycerol kinase
VWWLADGPSGPLRPYDMTHSNFLTSFRYAFSGIWHVLRTQRNARIHLSVALVVVILGLGLRLSHIEWAIIALTIALVLVAEAFNTVAETAVDLATAEYHPLAKIAKDVAAGAVLLMAIAAVIVGLLI